MRATVSLILVLALGPGIVGRAADGIWTTKADMPTARALLSTSVVDGKIYAIGGYGPQPYVGTSTVEEYDPTTNTWTTRSPMPTARYLFSTAVVDGRIYAIGGAEGWPTSAFRTVEEYDPKTDTWTTRSPIPTARTAFSTAVVDGKIYAVGGMLPASVGHGSRVVELYDPATDRWTSKAPMNVGRYSHGVCVVNGKIYAMGGVTHYPSQCPTAVEEYDPATDTWTMKGDMPTPKANFGVGVVGGRVYAIGGGESHPDAVSPAVYEYDPATDMWTAKADMLTPRTVLSASAVDGKIYAIGGSEDEDAWDPALATMEEYDPNPLIVDFNGDGTVGIEDLLRLIESWGQDDPAVDIAPRPFGDGIVDVQDLELLMSYWGQQVDDSTLVTHWAMDEAEGIIAHDIAGRCDGTVYGDPLWLPDGGVLGGALALDGDGDFVAADFVLDPSEGPFSVLAWINSGVPGQAIISQIDGEDWLMADAVAGTLATGLVPPRGRAPIPPLVSDTVVADSSWHRVAFVWDGSNRGLYVDDTLVAEDAQEALAGCTGAMNIGCGKDLTQGTFWEGLIDDVRIYNRAVKP